MSERTMQNVLGIYFLVSTPLFFLFAGMATGMYFCILNAIAILLVMGVFYVCTEGIGMFFQPDSGSTQYTQNSNNAALQFKDQHPVLASLIIDRVVKYCSDQYGFKLTRGELNGIIIAVNQIHSSDVELIIQFAKDHPFIFMHLAMGIADNYMEHKKRGTELKPQQIAAIIVAFNYFR